MITTCKHCAATFDGGVEIVGRPNARLEALLRKLGSHMNTKHPEHVIPLEINGAAYMGMLFLSNFKSTDAKLNEERDRQRWQIHQQTLNARFSDESLKEQCIKLAGSLQQDLADLAIHHDYVIPDEAMRQSFARIIIEAMTSIRDVLEEPNRYAEAKPEQLVS